LPTPYSVGATPSWRYSRLDQSRIANCIHRPMAARVQSARARSHQAEDRSTDGPLGSRWTPRPSQKTG
jgi:hypothetical protein